MPSTFPGLAHHQKSSKGPVERDGGLTGVSAHIYASLSPSSQSLSQIATMIYSNWHWIFKIFLLYVLLSRVCIWFGIYERRRPTGLVLTGLPSILGQRISAILSLVQSEKPSRKAYAVSGGKAFAIPTLTNYHVYVSSPKQIKELNNASSDLLSLNQTLVESIFPEYTMHGQNLHGADPFNSTVVFALKARLRPALSTLHPKLEEIVAESLQLAEAEVTEAGGWSNLSIGNFAQMLTTKANITIILGEDLAKDPSMLKAALRYSKDAGITTEVLKVVPEILVPLIGRLTMGWSGAERHLYKRIYPLVKQKLANHDPRNVTVDLLQFVVDKSRKEGDLSENHIYQQTLGLLFAGSLQIPMMISFILYNLCKYPQYLEPLRQEANSLSASKLGVQDNYAYPLLDSFLKESARLNSLRIGAVERKVMASHMSFSDGVRVPRGNWVMAAQREIMRDPANYPDPDRFDPYRFVSMEKGEMRSKSRFTHPSSDFIYWGSVGRACPGRFYVSVMAKMIVTHLLLHYELKLVDENVPSTFIWGVNTLPHPKLRILLRKRSS